MNSTLTFRSATIADVEAVVVLIESAYRGEGSRAGWTTEADLLDGQRTNIDEVSTIISGSHSRIRLALRSGELVGCVRVDDARDAGYIGMVTVSPTLQSAGIGRQLLIEAERVVRDELQLTSARMTVIGQRDTLIAWYERQGYCCSGKRLPFPYDNPRAGIPRRTDLYFEVLVKKLVRLD